MNKQQDGKCATLLYRGENMYGLILILLTTSVSFLAVSDAVNRCLNNVEVSE